jgi:hypothetical protein
MELQDLYDTSQRIANPSFLAAGTSLAILETRGREVDAAKRKSAR